MSNIKKICICAVCTALCYVLPQAFHLVGLGTALSPMHLPVLLCGMICGWPYGLVCGIVGPCLSSVLSGMPPASRLIGMVPELAVYGLVAGLLITFVRTKNLYADLYIALIPAMLAGRVVGGIAQAVTYLSRTESYTIAMWAASYLTGTIPAIIMHLIVVPVLVIALMKARLIPERYPKAKKA